MITIRAVRKVFGNVTAVDGLSLRIDRGEVFGLLGPNGAGKTTTISMMIGLLRPDEGEVTLDGLGSPTTAQVRRSIGVAPQAVSLYDDLTARENLRFFGTLYDLRGARLAQHVERVLEEVGLAPRGDDRAGTFSGGMKRRLNLAAALLHDPPVVLLDEPTAGVDPQSRNNILELVAGMKRAGRTVVYTTHYMEEAQRLCDRVAIVDKGRLLALGTVEDLVSRHGGESVVVCERGGTPERTPTREPLAELARAMAAEGPRLTAVRIETPSLESVFLNLTGRNLRDG
ncbi:MAG: ABC transporter ATP-binding protein [Phycisphaerales bacterium]